MARSDKMFSSFQSERIRMLELRQQKRQALYRVSACGSEMTSYQGYHSYDPSWIDEMFGDDDD